MLKMLKFGYFMSILPLKIRYIYLENGLSNRSQKLFDIEQKSVLQFMRKKKQKLGNSAVLNMNSL